MFSPYGEKFAVVDYDVDRDVYLCIDVFTDKFFQMESEMKDSIPHLFCNIAHVPREPWRIYLPSDLARNREFTKLSDFWDGSKIPPPPKPTKLEFIDNPVQWRNKVKMLRYAYVKETDTLYILIREDIELL